MLKRPGRRYGLGIHCFVEFLGHMESGVYVHANNFCKMCTVSWKGSCGGMQI